MSNGENITAKKLCIVTTVSITMKSFVVEMAKNLHDECGYDITLVCNNDESFAASLPEGLRYLPVHMGRGIDLSGFGAMLKLRRIFKEEKFDMVQYSTPNASLYASVAAWLAKVPKRLYCQWGMRYVGLPGFSRKIFKFLEKRVCKLSTHIHAVSHLNKAFAVREGLYRPEKATVVGNGGTIGVDMKSYDIEKAPEWRKEIREKYQISDDAFVFGFSGRISADKGCGEMLSAFRSLVEENTANYKLLVVGPLEEKCGVDESLVAWAKSSEHVVFTGKVDNTEMKNHYAAMDVLVHPTYREGFGMVIQEAGAIGVPVITTKIPGASEVMVDGISCLLVEPKNEQELKAAMKYIATDAQKKEQLSGAAYVRTRELYERSIMLTHQRKRYQELMDGEKL